VTPFVIYLINSAPHSLSSMAMLARTQVCPSNRVTKTILTFFLLNTNNANLVKPIDDWNSIVPKNSSLRDLSSSAAIGTNLFDAIVGYGCWCFLDPESEYRQNARGKPVDQIDSACKNLINGYKCATMDAEDNGEDDCDAQTVSYNSFNFFTGDPTLDLEADCISFNPDSVCAQRACQIEGLFTYPLLEGGFLPLENSALFDANLVHVSAGGTERSKSTFLNKI